MQINNFNKTILGDNMIVFITAKTSSPDSEVDNRFGRAAWLIRIDTENDQMEAFENQAVSQSGGAGITTAQFVIDHQGQVVISGDFGPNASSALRAAKIKMHLFTPGIQTVQQAVEAFKKEQLPSFE